MQTPPSQPTSFRYTVGEAEVIVLADGYRSFPLPDGFVANADKEAVVAALAEAQVPAQQMMIHFNPVVVRLGGRTMLIDTGNGPKAAAEEGSTRGWAVESMATAGLTPEDIDTVVISHFHGDHFAGLVDSAGKPTFPRASVMVPRLEWAFWMEEALQGEGPAKANAQTVRSVMESLMSQPSRYEWDQEIVPGLMAVGTPGHTPGHTSFMIDSKGEQLFIQSDVTNNPALFVRHPDWHLAFDMDKDQAVATRRKVYDRLADETIAVQGFHYPFPGRARITRDGGGYAYTIMDRA